MRDDSIIFIAETNYQLLYSLILNSYFKELGFNTILISVSSTKEIQNIARGLKDFDSKYFYNRYKSSNGKKDLFEEIRFIRKNILEFKNIQCKALILFKDANFIEAYLANFYRKNNNCSTILVEEGLSMYEKKGGVFNVSSKTIVKRYLRILLMHLYGANKVSYGFGYNKNVNILAVYNPEMIDSEKKIDKIVVKLPSKPPSESLFKNLHNIFDLEGLRDTLLLKGTDYLLYFGGPLTEHGLIELYKEKELLENLDRLANTNNFKIIIKPHPQEQESKYSMYSSFIIVKNKFIPGELIAKEFEPFATISVLSSASININRWWGISNIYLYKVLDLNIEKDLKIMKEQIVARDYDDLENLLRSILSKKENVNYSLDKNIDNEYFDMIHEMLINSILNDKRDSI